MNPEVRDKLDRLDRNFKRLVSLLPDARANFAAAPPAPRAQFRDVARTLDVLVESEVEKTGKPFSACFAAIQLRHADLTSAYADALGIRLDPDARR
jgi:hypothetical protein